MEKKLTEYTENVSKNISSKIQAIRSIVYHYDLSSIVINIKDLNELERNMVLEQLINNNLNLLKPILNKNNYRKIIREVEDITDFFDTDNISAISEEGDSITDDLLYKLMEENQWRLNLPISIENIKNYYVRSNIRSNEITDVLLWIILKLMTIYYCLTNPKTAN